MKVFVIQEECHTDEENYIIGVSDSRDNAIKLIDRHFGKDCYSVTSFKDVRDSGIDSIMSIDVDFLEFKTESTVTIHYYKLNA
jgi:hypothetical protein